MERREEERKEKERKEEERKKEKEKKKKHWDRKKMVGVILINIQEDFLVAKGNICNCQLLKT